MNSALKDLFASISQSHITRAPPAGSKQFHLHKPYLFAIYNEESDIFSEDYSTTIETLSNFPSIGRALINYEYDSGRSEH